MAKMHEWDRLDGDLGRWTVPGGWMYVDAAEAGTPAVFVPSTPRFVRLEELGDGTVLIDPAAVVAMRTNHDGAATYVDLGGYEDSGYVVKGTPAEVAAKLGLVEQGEEK